MSPAVIAPYLHFAGNCETAMQFYQTVFGGELQINRFSDFAGPDQAPQTNPTGIMHSVLTSGNLQFMASDAMTEHGLVVGDNISMSISGNDERELTSFFTKLSEGGTVTMPLAKQMWGDTFGMLSDQFGIHWMVNISVHAA